MTKETKDEVGKESLSKKIVGWDSKKITKKNSWIAKQDVKEKIQNAQKRLKEFNWFKGTDEPWEETLERFEKYKDKIFKEEFGDKLK